MDNILTSLIFSGLLMLGLAPGADDVAPSEGWLAKAIHAAADDDMDAYERGY